MARQWHNEPWRKLYTRIDGQWLRLSAVARGLAGELLKLADGEGVLLKLRAGEDRKEAVAALLAPKRWEMTIVAEAVGDLFEDAYLCEEDAVVRIRNFKAAQERTTPAALRKRRQRERDEEEDGHDLPPGQPVPMSRDMERDSHRDSHATVTGIETRRDETRRDEQRQHSHAPARTRTWTVSDLDLAWRTTLRVACGNHGDTSTLAAMMRDTAEVRGEEDVAAWSTRWLLAFQGMLTDWRERGVHHGGARVKDGIQYFAAVVQLMDGKKPATPAPRQAKTTGYQPPAPKGGSIIAGDG